MINSGRDILQCPYNDDDIQSIICLKAAVKTLEGKVNNSKHSDDIDYIKPCLDLDPGLSRHRTKFDMMCELKKHMDLHTHRVETHVLEITLLTPYTSESDLKVIDTLLKTDIENLEQVSKIMAIIPAAKCLG